jgi:hypothetical protein
MGEAEAVRVQHSHQPHIPHNSAASATKVQHTPPLKDSQHPHGAVASGQDKATQTGLGPAATAARPVHWPCPPKGPHPPHCAAPHGPTCPPRGPLRQAAATERPTGGAVTGIVPHPQQLHKPYPPVVGTAQRVRPPSDPHPSQAAAAGLTQSPQAVLGPAVTAERPMGGAVAVCELHPPQPHEPYPPAAGPVHQPSPAQNTHAPNAAAAVVPAHHLRALGERWRRRNRWAGRCTTMWRGVCCTCISHMNPATRAQRLLTLHCQRQIALACVRRTGWGF